MATNLKLMRKLSLEKVEITFSRTIAESVLSLLDKFSDDVIVEAQYNVISGLFIFGIYFNDSSVCNIFCRFYLEE